MLLPGSEAKAEAATLLDAYLARGADDPTSHYYFHWTRTDRRLEPGSPRCTTSEACTAHQILRRLGRFSDLALQSIQWHLRTRGIGRPLL